MKKTIFYVFALAFFAVGNVFAQSATVQHLNSGIQSAVTIQQNGVTAGKAVNQLVKEITILGTPNAELFNDKMYAQVASVQNNSDDVLYFMDLAKNASVVPFSTQEIDVLTSDLVSLNDELMYYTNQIVEALHNNNNDGALSLVPQVRDVLASQNDKAGQVIAKIEWIKQAVKRYNVCIQTVDYLGNPVAGSDLHGFYAQNMATGEYIYPTNQEGNCFEDLLPGTYRFDSYDGYWSGTSSEEVTLSDSLVNANGVIVVNLVYWSE